MVNAVVPLDRVRFREDGVGDAELDGDDELVEEKPFWKRSSAVIRVQSWPPKAGIRGCDQLGIVQSSTIFADAFSWAEMRKLISGLQRDVVQGPWGTMLWDGCCFRAWGQMLSIITRPSKSTSALW